VGRFCDPNKQSEAVGMTKLGASYFRDSGREQSGRNTKLGAGCSCVTLKQRQAVRRQVGKGRCRDHKSKPSGPTTKLGASRLGDSRSEPIGRKTKLGASPFVSLEKRIQRSEDKTWSESLA
jgi:hypothetical protein